MQNTSASGKKGDDSSYYPGKRPARGMCESCLNAFDVEDISSCGALHSAPVNLRAVQLLALLGGCRPYRKRTTC